MNSTFFVSFLMLTNFIFSQENVKTHYLKDIEELPIFHQIDIQKSQKNNVLLFQAKLQQFFITNIDSKKLVNFDNKALHSLDLKTTLDGKLIINNLSVFTNAQKEVLEKVLEKLSVNRAALKNGEEVAVEFSILLQIKFTEIKTIK